MINHSMKLISNLNKQHANPKNIKMKLMNNLKNIKIQKIIDLFIY